MYTLSDLLKLDALAVSGLSGVADSAAYKIHALEKRLCNKTLCYGKDAGDELLLDSLVPFRVTAGAGGAWSVAETVVSAGGVIEGGSATKKFSVVSLVVAATDALAGDIYEIQFLYGTGLVGAAVPLTSKYYVTPTANTYPVAIPLICDRIACNNKLWAKVKCDQDGKYLDFLLEITTYAA